jgi:excisionase family DNA binding protein
MANFREVMNAREASRYLGISKETLYKYLWQNRLPGFKLGNRWRFKKAVLDRWMEKQSEQPRNRTRPKGRLVVRA